MNHTINLEQIRKTKFEIASTEGKNSKQLVIELDHFWIQAVFVVTAPNIKQQFDYLDEAVEFYNSIKEKETI